MDEFSDIWIDQCQAARDIREEWGTHKARGYLVGEKLLNYIRASDSDPCIRGLGKAGDAKQIPCNAAVLGMGTSGRPDHPCLG